MDRQAQAAMAAFEMLGTTADSTWINTVMRACFKDDVVRALVMLRPDWREHIFTGVSDRGREVVMDRLAGTLLDGITWADIEAARLAIGVTALRLGREAMREV
jgi:flagellar motor switch protein FliG